MEKKPKSHISSDVMLLSSKALLPLVIRNKREADPNCQIDQIAIFTFFPLWLFLLLLTLLLLLPLLPAALLLPVVLLLLPGLLDLPNTSLLLRSPSQPVKPILAQKVQKESQHKRMVGNQQFLFSLWEGCQFLPMAQEITNMSTKDTKLLNLDTRALMLAPVY